MTCIVGIAEKGKVYIGGDSAGVAGLQTVVRSDSKVFHRQGVSFGFTTSFRMGQLLRYKLKVPNHPKTKDDVEYLTTDFIDSVIKCFETNKFANKDGEQISGGSFIIGYRGNIYEVGSDFQLAVPSEGYSSVGCGDQIALGSLFSTKNFKMKPKDRIILALEAATAYSGGVLPPYTIIEN